MWRTEDAVKRDWQHRWEASRAKQVPNQGPAADTRGDTVTKGNNLRLYDNMDKAYASALCQARTGKIGLREFLFTMRVPSVMTPMCQCGEGEQNVAHLFCDCLHERSTPLRAMGFPTPGTVQRGLRDPETAPRMAKALVRSGWLHDFRVFEELRQLQMKEYNTGDTERPPPHRDKTRHRRVAL